MKAISYLASKDQLSLRIASLRAKLRKEVGRFTIWSDGDGRICGLEINCVTEALEDFKKSLGTVRLGGIWKGVNISDEEIREARQEMLKKLEEKW